MSVSEASLTSLQFRRLRAVSRLLGLEIVVEDDELVLAPAAAERSPAWSSGQVTRPETFNVRAGAPEPGGLFCPAIFADEPGRTGHVELMAPVVPGPARPLLAALLGVSEVELVAVGVDELVARVERAEAEGRTIQGWRPRQLVWWSLPVLSPVLRVREPEEVLARDDDGRFATHTLHEPYRRVMLRAARLARLYELKAPEEMVAHEHHGLVEAIGRLLDPSGCGRSAGSPSGLAKTTSPRPCGRASRRRSPR